MDREQCLDLFDRFAAMVGARVRVALTDSSFSFGVLLAIDPETQHVALAHGGDDGKVHVKMLLCHGIRGIELDEEADDDNDEAVKALLHSIASSKPSGSTDSDEVVASRAERLSQFLNKNFVPFEREEKTLSVFGGAGEVLTPFDSPSCCHSDNPRLHARLQQLMERFLEEETRAFRD